MRIVSGKYRRRLLQTNPGDTTRPITDRAKVALFDRIQPLLDAGPRVADVFSGTGTMGLEALSRGAKSVVFFEQDQSAHELLKQNVEMLGVQAETVCWRTDVFRTSFRPKGEACKDFLPYDLIFFDPPYRLAPKIQQKSLLYAALERLGNTALCSPGALLVLRCDEHARFELPPMWPQDEIHRINRMMLYFYRFQPVVGETSGETVEVDTQLDSQIDAPTTPSESLPE
ncbi:MAG: 16S rRNA (guanine(966)-N(2))-methyltransferase RsmD [Planctomycetota bacterium]